MLCIENDFRYVSNEKKRNQNLAAFVRQYVALTGLDMECFSKTLEAAARVHRFFEDFLSIEKLEPFQPISIDGFDVLACHTRYFMPRRNCRLLVEQPFGPGVDPNGDLERIKGNTYIHTEDNIVQYLEEKKKNDELMCVICENFFFFDIFKFCYIDIKTSIQLDFRRETLSN